MKKDYLRNFRQSNQHPQSNRKKNFLSFRKNLCVGCGYYIMYTALDTINDVHTFVLYTHKWYTYVHIIQLLCFEYIFFAVHFFSTQRPTLVKSIYEVFRGLG